MRKFFPFLCSLYALACAAVADDPDCVRNNCLGSCISKQEAMSRPVPMLCRSFYVCYKDIECIKQDDGKCGWKETPELKACLAEKSKPSPALAPVR